MVHQHFSLVEALTVWENVALGDTGRFVPAAARRRVAEISEHYGLGVDPDARVADLPAGVRQRVEIIKCLRRDPEIIIFDEPTSVLTPGESERLFEVLRTAVRDENKAVALVSHKLDEVLQATDEITIMRAGRVVEAMATAEANAPRLARAMVGRDVSLRSEAAALGLVAAVEQVKGHHSAAPSLETERVPALALRNVVVTGTGGATALDDLTLVVPRGKIVGVAGVEGNGQAAITEVLSSLVTVDSGTVEVDGEVIATGRAGSMARAGVGVIPADRHDSGCVLDMTVAENLFLAHLERLAHRGFYDQAAMNDKARELIAEFEIQTPGPTAPFFTLSGGNQQRVILARELSHGPAVLVADQPTHGLDVGAIEYMSNRLRRVADEGVGVLLISSELEELLHLADTIVVLFRGRVVGEMARDEVDLERLGLLMGGVVESGVA
jgi:simple sugar transport system ATP-binding protein